jgi:hypothetical protein
MHCWWVTSSVFVHDVLHVRLSAGLTHLSLQGYQQLDAGCLGLKLETDWSWPPIIRTIRLQQKTTHSDTLCFPSVAILTLHRNVLQEDDILCECSWEWCVRWYQVISATWRYTQLRDTVFSLLDRILGQNHHIYQDNCYNSMRLAQTLLYRYLKVCRTMRANRGITYDLGGEGKHLKKGSQHSRGKVM